MKHKLTNRRLSSGSGLDDNMLKSFKTYEQFMSDEFSYKEKDRESFIRWQEVTRAQLTYAINLILSFAVATLGFQVSVLIAEGFPPFSWEKVSFSFSTILIFLSIVQGIIAVICRLFSFRYTTKITRSRNDYQKSEMVRQHRNISKCLDKHTWGLFLGQVGLFGIGIIMSMLSMFKKLF
ncbi:TPA: hypothetical protein ACSP3M_004018 [Aeromonas veronii]